MRCPERQTKLPDDAKFCNECGHNLTDVPSAADARPDLSPTYFEVGKRMLEPQIKYRQLNGIDANGYLEKAGILFEDRAWKVIRSIWNE